MIHLDRTGSIGLTDQIVQQFAALIQAGQLPAGSRLPSIRKLAATLTVSSATVVAAYDRLAARGLTISRAASGYFVQARPAPEAPSLVPPRRETIDAVWQLRRMLDTKPSMLPAGSGYLPEAWLEDMLSTRLLVRLARSGQRAFASPAGAQGYAPLRRQLSLKLGQAGIPAHPDQIVMTFGATQAVDIIIRLLLVAGDTVAIEEPNYYGLTAQLRANGIRLIPIPRRTDGPDLDSLETACTHYRPKLFFTQTLMHNPTGTSTSIAVASRLLQLAERHDLLVVEDDVYGDLFPTSNPVHLAQIDRLQRVIYVSSFSKVVSPNIRVGFMAAPEAFVEAFIEAKMLSVLATSEFDERLIYEVLAEGRYRKHLERVRLRLARQWPSVVTGLRQAGLQVETGEHAAFFVWASLPPGLDEESLVRDAAENNILLTPGSVFFLGETPRPWLRFSAASANVPRLFAYMKARIAALTAISKSVLVR
ncbi:MAG: PLP-dependent aminotransferase family protein [Rhodocyclaceae bacterium]|nr:PLP-dependent aminotransferase family protein [Rhodocyclaceae bacterium]